MELLNLDERTRELMSTEIEADVSAGRLYVSTRLAPPASDYPEVLRAAARSKDIVALANDLRGRLMTHEQRRKPKGGHTLAKIPVTAADTLAEGEFNRFYIRAVCQRAIEEGRAVEVYRAKAVRNPRPESEALIGTRPDPRQLLEDLTLNIGANPWLGIPGGPNSGLSVHLVD